MGKYVGWTAPTIQKKFKEAQGSVLFIDEAYSLVDDRNGSFGDEAINTIVQEMENHRDDVVVIFAGYPDKMEDFLQKNPGLRSRIAYHVPFDDYDTESLCEIAKLIAKQKGLKTMSAQAVGGAVGHNSISLIIPCHRVVGTNGSLTGYAGGIDKKIYLLKHEEVNMENLVIPRKGTAL